MKKTIGIVLAVFLCVAPIAAAETYFHELKGSDWLQMKRGQKELFLYTCVGGLQSKGVVLMKTPHYYEEALDKILAVDPDLKSEPLDNLFVFCVYESEPHVRPVIDKIRKTAAKEAVYPAPAGRKRG
jgi:hypothetical protein